MAYTKIADQTPFAANLQPNEIVVRLDMGAKVALRADINVQRLSGVASINGFARVVKADGSNFLDPQGNPVTASVSHTTSTAQVQQIGSIKGVVKLCFMALLGEPTDPLWLDPIHAEFLDHASIRTTIANAQSAGPVTDASTIL